MMMTPNKLHKQKFEKEKDDQPIVTVPILQTSNSEIPQLKYEPDYFLLFLVFYQPSIEKSILNRIGEDVPLCKNSSTQNSRITSQISNLWAISSILVGG